MIVVLSIKGEDMLSIARRTASGCGRTTCDAFGRMVLRLDVAAGPKRHVAENVILDNGNCDTAVGDHHACSSLRLVPVVPAFSSARSAGVICYPRRGHSGGSGRKILG